jgi:DNA processing protein
MDDEKQERAYWLLLAFESKLPKRVISDIIVNWCYQRSGNIQEFFSLSEQQWSDICQLDENNVTRLKNAREKIVDQVTLMDQLEQKGFHILTVLDENYPRALKSTLSLKEIPPVLFYAGNLEILELLSVAIIGSRNATDESLEFTHLAAQYLSEQGANVISGNARGVDLAALEGAINSIGWTTLVLPEGILKLSKAQMSLLQPKIESGNVLLMSQFHPLAQWVVSRAMDRNKLVTGLAQVVIVAESNTQGGTWEAAHSALKQSRPLYVRQSNLPTLLPGNNALLKSGGRPLYWPIENNEEEQASIDNIISPLLETEMLNQRRKYIPSLSVQISRLLEEQRVYS